MFQKVMKISISNGYKKLKRSNRFSFVRVLPFKAKSQWIAGSIPLTVPAKDTGNISVGEPRKQWTTTALCNIARVKPSIRVIRAFNFTRVLWLSPLYWRTQHEFFSFVRSFSAGFECLSDDEWGAVINVTTPFRVHDNLYVRIFREIIAWCKLQEIRVFVLLDNLKWGIFCNLNRVECNLKNCLDKLQREGLRGMYFCDKTILKITFF